MHEHTHMQPSLSSHPPLPLSFFFLLLTSLTFCCSVCMCVCVCVCVYMWKGGAWLISDRDETGSWVFGGGWLGAKGPYHQNPVIVHQQQKHLSNDHSRGPDFGTSEKVSGNLRFSCECSRTSCAHYLALYHRSSLGLYFIKSELF